METELTFNKETNIRDYRRECIIGLIEQGVSQKVIAQGLDCSQGMVSQVKSAYERAGAEGIKIQTPPGAQAQLDEQDLSKLKSWLLQGAMAFGYSTDHWTWARVKTLIARKFGVEYRSLTTAGNILAKLGFT